MCVHVCLYVYHVSSPRQLLLRFRFKKVSQPLKSSPVWCRVGTEPTTCLAVAHCMGGKVVCQFCVSHDG